MKTDTTDRPRTTELFDQPIKSDGWKNLYQIEGEGMVWGIRVFATERAAIDHFQSLEHWPDPVWFTALGKDVPKAHVKFAIPMPCGAP